MNHDAELNHEFGGVWTRRKLEILRNYLNAFTTSLKNKRFDLVYVDSHAGDGIWVPKDGDPIDGSPLIALKTDDSKFAELFLNDDDSEKVMRLKHRVRGSFPHRQGVHYSCEDADRFLVATCRALKNTMRGVAFFDPYNSQSSWSSMQAVAKTEVLDAIILYPAGAIWRQLPNRVDANRPHPFARNLTRFFGDQSWNQAYDPKFAAELRERHGLGGGSQPMMDLSGVEIRSEHDLIPYIYKERLEEEFGAVYMKPVPIPINRSSYFEMIFAVSNPSQTAQELALRIFDGVVASLR